MSMISSFKILTNLDLFLPLSESPSRSKSLLLLFPFPLLFPLLFDIESMTSSTLTDPLLSGSKEEKITRSSQLDRTSPRETKASSKERSVSLLELFDFERTFCKESSMAWLLKRDSWWVKRTITWADMKVVWERTTSGMEEWRREDQEMTDQIRSDQIRSERDRGGQFMTWLDSNSRDGTCQNRK